MTDKQIRDRIVGALSVSMMPMEMEAECVAFLDRCLEAAKAIRGMAKALSGCKDICDVCANRKALPLDDCEDADCDCTICKADCACARCEDGSYFVWKENNPMKETFEPGQEVWAIERDQDGNACDVSGYLLMAQGDGVAILTSYINDYDWEETLEYHIECTREDYDTHLAVFPIEDCFADRDACEAAIVAEQGGPYGTE